MGQDEGVSRMFWLCVCLTAWSFDLIYTTKKNKENYSGPPGNDAAKLGQHTVSIMQSKVHFIWKSPIIVNGWFWGRLAAGGDQTTALCTGGLKGLRGSGLTKEDRAVTQRKYLLSDWWAAKETQEEAKLSQDSTAGSNGQRGTASSPDSLGPVAQPTCHFS